MYQSWKDSFNCMFPKRSSEFAVFFILCPFFVILLGRVDNPMRDDLDIFRSEIFPSNSENQFG